MSDELDLVEETTSAEKADRIMHISALARAIPVGYAGECDICLNHSPRLVDGVCARCRDRYKLP